MHLQSKSYSQHKALGRYYEDVIDLADRYAEAFQGCYDVIDTYPADFHIAKVPLTYIQKIKDFVDGMTKGATALNEFLNNSDNIATIGASFDVVEEAVNGLQDLADLKIQVRKFSVFLEM